MKQQPWRDNRKNALILGEHDPARRELDGLIINIELTLISVIQGTALYFLIDTAKPLLLNRTYEAWPYVFSSLLFLLTFWARALIHILTVIKWPLEFGHNFLYVGCVIIEAVMFTQAGTFSGWYPLSVAYAGVAWILFVFDQRMVDQLIADYQSEKARELCDALNQEQRLNVRFFLPGMMVFGLAATYCLRAWPETFLEGGMHLAFIGGQLFFGLLYLNHVVHFYLRLAPKILAFRRDYMNEGQPE